MCGEKLHCRLGSGCFLGSPPRVRGKVSLIGVTDTAPGITPACAGKRADFSEATQWEQDHPRVCGEKPWRGSSYFDVSGSPPRVRGKAGSVALPVRCSGITPACAGKRPLYPAFTVPSWDHPRVCGEKASCQAWRRSGRGSPPRVRGKDGQVRICGHEIGITPACAGKS